MGKKTLLAAAVDIPVKAAKWLAAFIIFRLGKGMLESLWKALTWFLKGAWSALAALGSWAFRAASGIAGRAASSIAAKTEETVGRKPVFARFAPVRAFEGGIGDFEGWLYSSKSTVGIILGARGSGKSALGVKILENWAAKGRKVCAMGFSEAGLPAWIRDVREPEDAPNGAVLLVDEGGIEFSARKAMSNANVLLSSLLFIARHKDLSLVFITQNSANLEINSIRQADYLLLKRPSLLQKDFERDKIKDIYSKVVGEFKELGEDMGLVYVYSDKFRGFASNPLPSFWTEKAAKAFAGKKIG
jgi:hypothetical protein